MFVCQQVDCGTVTRSFSSWSHVWTTLMRTPFFRVITQTGWSPGQLSHRLSSYSSSCTSAPQEVHRMKLPESLFSWGRGSICFPHSGQKVSILSREPYSFRLSPHWGQLPSNMYPHVGQNLSTSLILTSWHAGHCCSLMAFPPLSAGIIFQPFSKLQGSPFFNDWLLKYKGSIAK